MLLSVHLDVFNINVSIFDYSLNTTDESKKTYVSEICRNKLMNIFPCNSFLIFLKSIVDEFQDEVLVEVVKHRKIEKNKSNLKNPFIMLFILSDHHIQSPCTIISTNYLSLMRQSLPINNMSRATKLKSQSPNDSVLATSCMDSKTKLILIHL